MPGYLVRLASVGVVLLCAVSLPAAEPAPVETLPPPRPAGPTGPMLLPPPGYPVLPYIRRSRYEVWDYYGVDITGRFRPRVLYSSEGAFYLYNGKPYPWTATHQLYITPRAVD